MSYNIQRTTFKVSDFITWYKNKSLVLDPDFQRRSVWNAKSQSFLIDTIIRGLPIPVIILRDRKTDLDSFLPIKEVVDGQQRLRTVLSFVLKEKIEDMKPFKLSKTHNELNGGNFFNELEDEIKEEILNYEFFVHVLPSTVSNKEILEIFSRMNSTGVNLNDQELRNASYYGEFKTAAFSLGNEHYEYWINWKLFTEGKIARMEEVEFINDLLVFAIDGIIRRTPQSITKYYNNYDDEGSIPNKDLIIKRIRNIITFLDDVYGDHFAKSSLKKPQLIYAIYSVIYENEFKNNTSSSIKANKTNFSENLEKLSQMLAKAKLEWRENKSVVTIPEKVYDAVTRATNLKENRKIVFDYINKILY